MFTCLFFNLCFSEDRGFGPLGPQPTCFPSVHLQYNAKRHYNPSPTAAYLEQFSTPTLSSGRSVSDTFDYNETLYSCYIKTFFSPKHLLGYLTIYFCFREGQACWSCSQCCECAQHHENKERQMHQRAEHVELLLPEVRDASDLEEALRHEEITVHREESSQNASFNNTLNEVVSGNNIVFFVLFFSFS